MIIVSAYYDIPNKRNKDFYFSNLRLFFNLLNNDKKIVFFTDELNYNLLKSYENENIKFIIKPFEELRVFKKFPENFWIKQIEKDVEKYHTWQLSALWANKKYFVEEAIELYNLYEWFIWVDCGCIRTIDWESSCINFTKRDLPKKEGIYLQLLNQLPNDILFFKYPDIYVSGAIILFHKKYISEFINNYNILLNVYNDNNLCSTSDQYIMASMIQFNNSNLNCIYCNYEKIDRWFFFLNYF
jgi:hypothetical protein